MAAIIIDGDTIAAGILEETKKMVDGLKDKSVFPKLSVILVGENPASEIYIERKKLACETLGIEFELLRLRETITEKELAHTINELNFHFDTHGILVQLPLPRHIDRAKIIGGISPLKDVDGFTAFNLGLLCHGKEEIVSCTALAIVKLIESTGQEIAGKNACIVNHSIVVGRPLSQLLLNRNATVTICHAGTEGIDFFTRQADILVTAVGKPGLIKSDMVKAGAIVIDAGIARENGKTKGDVDFDAVKEIASYITPVPGGVGPMTVACLMQNLAKLAALQRK